MPRAASAVDADPDCCAGTAGVVCAVTGAAGLAGSLATRAGTLTALAVVVAGALVAAGLGRDPAVRMVAWVVGAAAALRPTGRRRSPPPAGPCRPAPSASSPSSGLLVAVAWVLAAGPGRRAEAGVVDLCAALGAGIRAAADPRLGPARGGGAHRLGCPARARRRCAGTVRAARRHWLCRAALAAELGACWLLLYSVEVGLAEAYTLPFAAVALSPGALELRRRPDLSSWVAYGPALAGGFLPSLGPGAGRRGHPVWRWVTLFAAAIGGRASSAPGAGGGPRS